MRLSPDSILKCNHVTRLSCDNHEVVCLSCGDICRDDYTSYNEKKNYKPNIKIIIKKTERKFSAHFTLYSYTKDVTLLMMTNNSIVSIYIETETHLSRDTHLITK